MLANIEWMAVSGRGSKLLQRPKSNLDRNTTHPQVQLTRVQTHDLWIMYRICPVAELFVLNTEPLDTSIVYCRPCVFMLKNLPLLLWSVLPVQLHMFIFQKTYVNMVNSVKPLLTLFHDRSQILKSETKGTNLTKITLNGIFLEGSIHDFDKI